MAQVPCFLSHILVEEQTDSQVIFLTELGGKRRLPIVIGPLEAGAIVRAVKDERFSRPLTHDLLANLIDETSHRLREVRIVDLREGTFFAELVLEDHDGKLVAVDCRPSDAVALQVRIKDCPLTVADKVFEAAAEE